MLVVVLIIQDVGVSVFEREREAAVSIGKSFSPVGMVASRHSKAIPMKFGAANYLMGQRVLGVFLHPQHLT